MLHCRAQTDMLHCTYDSSAEWLQSFCHLQVVSITDYEGLTLLPPFSSLCHLIITARSLIQACERLHGFDALETLSLIGETVHHGMALDLMALPALSHLHIENFAPSAISVPHGCKLHISWDDENNGATVTGRGEWLKSKSWAALAVPLVSFR